MTLMLEELRSVPLSELQVMLDENLAEHAELRSQGYGPGDEDFDQNSMLWVVISSALGERSLFA